MAWTYLQLCNRVLRRMNEVQLTASTFPTAVGFQASVQDAVNDALNDIYDAELNWPFLWSATTQATTANVQSYPLPINTTEVDYNSFFRQANIVTNPKQQPLKMVFISYQQWQDMYKPLDANIIANYVLGSTSNQNGAPERVFPYQDKLHFGVSTVPDTAYTLYYEYWFKPTDLVAATDTMIIPDMFSKVVIDGATYYSYMFRDNVEEAGPVETKFKEGIGQMRTRLINKMDYMRSDEYSRDTYKATPGYF